HLGYGSERLPRKFGLDDLHLFREHTRVFGVAAVKFPAQSAHRCRDDIALAKLASGRCLDKTDGLDTQDSRKFDTWRMALPSEQLGPVEPECFHANQNFGPLRCGDRKAFNFENL